MRVLPPGGPPKRVNSGPFPGAEPHALCKAKPVKLKKVAFSHFFDTLNKPFGLVCSCQLMVYFIKA